jgi:hypothetical protein
MERALKCSKHWSELNGSSGSAMNEHDRMTMAGFEHVRSERKLWYFHIPGLSRDLELQQGTRLGFFVVVDVRAGNQWNYWTFWSGCEVGNRYRSQG